MDDAIPNRILAIIYGTKDAGQSRQILGKWHAASQMEWARYQ
jgi:hypothetical protein